MKLKALINVRRLKAIDIVVSTRNYILIVILIFSYRDTAGQERFRTITTAYYRGAMVCYCLCAHCMVWCCACIMMHTHVHAYVHTLYAHTYTDYTHTYTHTHRHTHTTRTHYTQMLAYIHIMELGMCSHGGQCYQLFLLIVD